MGIDSAVPLGSSVLGADLKDDTPIAGSSKVLGNVLQLIVVICRRVGSILAHQGDRVANIGSARYIGIHHFS